MSKLVKKKIFISLVGGRVVIANKSASRDFLLFLEVFIYKIDRCQKEICLQRQKSENETLSIMIHGCVKTSENIEILSINERAFQNGVTKSLHQIGLEVKNIFHEKFPIIVLLFGSKRNGNIVALINKAELIDLPPMWKSKEKL